METARYDGPYPYTHALINSRSYLNLLTITPQVAAGLAQQLTSLWSNATNVDSWMPVLLETFLVLTSHPSLTLAHTTNSVWLALFKHEQISKLPHLQAVVSRWLQLSAPKVLKVCNLNKYRMAQYRGFDFRPQLFVVGSWLNECYQRYYDYDMI